DLGGFRAVVGARTRLYLDPAVQNAVASQAGLPIFLRVSRVTELDRDLLGIDFLAHVNHLRSRVNLCGVAENRAFEPLIDNAVVLDEVVGEKASNYQSEKCKHPDRGQDDGIARYRPGFPRLISLRNL